MRIKNICKAVVLSLLVSILYGCEDFAHEEKIMGEYYLIAVDSKYDMSVSRRLESDRSSYIGRVDRTVFEVGHNDRYIVAKQHPDNKESKVNFFIIDTFSDSDHAERKKAVIGPLNEEEFNEKLEELGVSNDIKFSKVM